MRVDLSRKMSSKKWLAQNGLSAKKLTIIDLIGPTMISHEPKYVSAIDRKVLSKVFDEVRCNILLIFTVLCVSEAYFTGNF